VRFSVSDGREQTEVDFAIDYRALAGLPQFVGNFPRSATHFRWSAGLSCGGFLQGGGLSGVDTTLGRYPKVTATASSPPV
jgi:hypothetical protein